jgi:hypothetical protein
MQLVDNGIFVPERIGSTAHSLHPTLSSFRISYEPELYLLAAAVPRRSKRLYTLIDAG